LARLGFRASEIEALGRIERTLHRWDEAECGTERGCIERDEETGKTYWLNAMTGDRSPVADRETAAKKRLAKIMAEHKRLVAYHQSDCRGVALYILRKRDINGESVDSIYTRGVAVC
jgi:hypothetical protein